MKKICLSGYSGHGYVVAEIVRLLQYSLIGYIDIEEKNYNPYQLEYLGNDGTLNKAEFIKEKISVALGIGDNIIRSKVFQQLKNIGIKVESLQHPKAIISASALIGEGSVVMASATINPFVNIGNGVICNSGCIIEHECTIKNFVHVAPGAVLAGNVKVGHSTFIGANAFIKQGLIIGDNVVIGAGAVVLADVPDNAIVYGNPAKVKK